MEAIFTLLILYHCQLPQALWYHYYYYTHTSRSCLFQVHSQFCFDSNSLPLSFQPAEDISVVSWNRQVQHILASANPSGKAVVWDLRKNEPIIKISDHSNRVGSLLTQDHRVGFNITLLRSRTTSSHLVEIFVDIV